MKSLSKLESVSKELEVFEKGIEKLPSRLKPEASRLLSEIKKIIQDIDVGHNPAYNGYILPHSLSDKREKLNNYRHTLNQYLRLNNR